MKNPSIGNKKAIMALEALFGLVISGITLILIFNVFAAFFLSTPTNQKIAESNAESIGTFVNYFSKHSDYGSFDNCYVEMKLEHLENFQFKEENQNYFYVIKEEGIYLLKFQYLELLVNDENFDLNKFGKIKKEWRFNSNVNILKDVTYEGNTLLSSAGDFIGLDLGKVSDKIHLEELQRKELILIPEFEENQNKFRLYYIYDKKLYGRNKVSINNNEQKELEGNSIVFDIYKRNLFIPVNEVSETLVKKNLCSYKLLWKKDIETYYSKNNGKNIDYINNDILFRFKNEQNNFVNTCFAWKENKPLCFKQNDLCLNKNKKEVLTKLDITQSNCNILPNQDQKEISLNYLDFIIEIENYVIYTTDQELDNVKLYVEVKKNSFVEMITNNQILSINYYFNDLFKPILDENYEEVNVAEVYNNKKNKEFYDISKWWGGNHNFNGCDENLCNELYYNNANFYFYYDNYEKKQKKIGNRIEYIEDGDFYRFNEMFLRKKTEEIGGEIGYKVYLNGNEIKLHGKLEADKFGISLFNEDNKFIYWFKINFQEGIKDIILSPRQFENIPEYGVEK